VLRRRNLGEADRLVTVLTRDRGKLTLVARGARRPRSRLGGRLEPATRFRALIAEGRSIDIISQVEVLDAHAALRDELERMGAAAVVLELADRALADRHPHPDVYRLALTALELVEHSGSSVVWLWFAARLLVLTGHRPAVARCAVCSGRFCGPVYWSDRLGGCVHQACAVRDPRAGPLTQGAAALLAFLLDARPSAVGRLAPAPTSADGAGTALRAYAEACWETRLRAPAVVGQLRAAQPPPDAKRRTSDRPRVV
jgi:DNA repair protein RecO (recombination protein O)